MGEACSLSSPGMTSTMTRHWSVLLAPLNVVVAKDAAP